ncbi:hypothetical protein LTR57_018388 [Friedmanniomyces endolithicus]|nr:hypothetical protein LTR57_018388 [Friedmanniomyces endolithicus]
MKTMQRKFGGLMKRKDDEADVGNILAEFKAVDEMLTQLIRDLTAFRNSWDDILKLQYDTIEALAFLYTPLEPASDPDQRRPPTTTPQTYMQKCLGLQKVFSEVKTDLSTELNLIDSKLVRPATEAKAATKGLGKTLKHRENCKLDYERYLSRAEHGRKKDTRSMKEEASLAAYESNLAQAQIDYETADDQVKQTFPPVTAAMLDLMPYLLANQVQLQTTLVGQLYTVIDKYTRTHGMANPAPGDGEIVRVWEQEFGGLRRELEQGIAIVAGGKAVQRGMDLPADKGNTVTGLGIRNKAGGMMHMGGGDGTASSGASSAGGGEQQGSSMTGLGIRNKAGGMMHKGSGMIKRPGSGHSSTPSSSIPAAGERPASWQRRESGMSSGTTSMTVYDDARSNGQDDYDEPPPPKPLRPGGGSPGMMMIPSPSIPMSSKPGRSPPSNYTASPPYPQDLKSAAAVTPPSWSNGAQRTPSYGQASATGVASTLSSRYGTPLSNTSNNSGGGGSVGRLSGADYFPTQNPSRSSSSGATIPSSSSAAFTAASIAAAGKKKPPPPPSKPASAAKPPPPAEYVTAMYDFEGQDAGDLVFREGERILVLERTGVVEDWWVGEVVGREGERGGRGSFPGNYVR